MPEFICLKGKHNIVTDALCQLELDTPEFLTPAIMHDMHYLTDHYAVMISQQMPFHYNMN